MCTRKNVAYEKMRPAARKKSAAGGTQDKQCGRWHPRKTVRPSACKGEERPSAREEESGLRRAGESAAFGTQQREWSPARRKDRGPRHTTKNAASGQRPAAYEEE
jgi:hypothetical protein